MATGKIVVNVVDVGQGQCTFVEMWDNGTPAQITGTLLFDCGSGPKGKSPFVQTNLDYIVASVKSMATPKFNAVFFSHSDSDHVNLMEELLDKFLPAKPPIDEVWFGGSRVKYKKNKVNILNYIIKQGYCTFANVKATPVNDSQIDVSTGLYKAPPLWKSGDDTVEVWLLVGNVLASDPANMGETPAKKRRLENPEFLNRVSLVCDLRFAGKDYVICGDATNRTMAIANYYAQNSAFKQTVMLTLPHHGSRATGLSVSKKQKATPNNILTVEKFSKLVSGKTLTASAYKQHNHPSLELIEFFTPNALQKPVVKDTRLVDDSHYVVVFTDRLLKKPDDKTIQKNYTTFATESNLYATYCFKDTPTFSLPHIKATTVKTSDPVATVTVPAPAFNAHASWVYTTASGGTTSMLGCSSLPPTTGTTGTIFTAPASGVLSFAASESFTEEPLMVEQPAPVRPIRISIPARPPAPAARSGSSALRAFR